MNRNRDQILYEMGLSPLWKLRSKPAVTASPFQNKQEENGLGQKAEFDVLTRAQNLSQAQQISQVDWDALHHSISSCQACGLCKERKQTVPGVGDRQASWMLIGEGPGVEEDAQGEPFVGQAGKLLDAMLEAIDLKRGEDVYIANAVKCRPPRNRTPDVSEMTACFPYLKRQIALINPKLIILLGRAAVQAVLGGNQSLSSLRGKIFHYENDGQNIPAMVTYHPAYLLRNLPDKLKAWEDLCRVRRFMKTDG